MLLARRSLTRAHGRVADRGCRARTAIAKRCARSSKKGLDVNEAQGDGTTALHWAAIKGDAEMAQMLIYAGANVRATTRIGAYTPLYLAAKGGYSDVVAALLAAGADAKAVTANGTTPLMIAAAAGDTRSITSLDRERRRHQREGRREGRDAADVRRRLQPHRRGEAAARARRRSQGHDQGRRPVRADRAGRRSDAARPGRQQHAARDAIARPTLPARRAPIATTS